MEYVGIMVVSSSGSSNGTLISLLRAGCSVRILKYTLYKLSNLTVMGECRPSILFLSIRLPSIGNLSFLSGLSKFIRHHYRIIVCATCSRCVLATFHGRTFSILLGPVGPRRLSAVIEQLRGRTRGRTKGRLITRGRTREIMKTNIGGTPITGNGLLFCAGSISFELISGRGIYLFRCGRRIEY